MFEVLKQENEQKVVSYDKLQFIIGGLAFAIPLVMVYGSKYLTECPETLDSLSAYYHTDMRNWFVGILCCVAFFLFAYNGYEKRDSIAGTIAAIGALMVAFFPTGLCDNIFDNCQWNTFSLTQLDASICANVCGSEVYTNSTIHFAGAGIFFASLIYFSLVLFVQSETPRSQWDAARWRHYWTHKICGGFMLIAVLIIPINTFLLNDFFKGTNYILDIEWIALWAFGVSWFTKALRERKKRMMT